MPSAVLLFALSAGLCATGLAAPLKQEIQSSLNVLNTDPAFLPKSTLAEWSTVDLTEPFDINPTIHRSSTVTQVGGVQVGAVEDALALDLPSIETSEEPQAFRVPEPATFLPAALGCLVIAFLGYYRLNYRSNRRRRHSRMRPLTVLR
jgi:hypothetical protein